MSARIGLSSKSGIFTRPITPENAMSLLDTPIREVLKGSFAPEIWKDMVTPILDTLYITAVAAADDYVE